jgi:hypothetical protein
MDKRPISPAVLALGTIGALSIEAMKVHFLRSGAGESKHE